HWRFTGFADLDAAELARLTGLPLDAARRALQRDFSEPLLWQDTADALAAFTAALQRRGLALLRGGRFLHAGAAVDKGTPLPWLRRHYARDGSPVEVIALGDGGNDCAMLEAADHPVLVRSPVNAPPTVRHPGLRVTDETGPAGWNRAVLALLEDC